MRGLQTPTFRLEFVALNLYLQTQLTQGYTTIRPKAPESDQSQLSQALHPARPRKAGAPRHCMLCSRLYPLLSQLPWAGLGQDIFRP